ncbi:hypothetical protein ABMA57_16430 [Saccharospirillum sp. HFRX-1]|uniref:hypothetical protein n=1 Tax=unclassified Saccharospirillum TaxID=2633430 RepID=UPI0037199EA0
MALEAEVLVDRSRQLIEQGLRLQSEVDTEAMAQWDDAVNEWLQDVNLALAQDDFSSRPLQRHLGILIELYQQSVAEFAQLRDDQAATTAELHQKRWKITG